MISLPDKNLIKERNVHVRNRQTPTQILNINSIDSPKIVICIVPGNPGIANLYVPFMKALYNAWSGKAEVIAFSHYCHNLPTQELVSLEQQLNHTIDVIQDYVLTEYGVHVIFIGHSLGSWLLLNAQNHLDNMAASKNIKILKFVSMTPFFEADFEHGRARRLNICGTYHNLMGVLGGILGYIPKSILAMLLKMLEGNHLGNHCISACTNLMSYYSIRQYFFLAGQYISHNIRFDMKILSNLSRQNRIVVMVCPNDTWMTNKIYNAISQNIEKVHFVKQFRHAFVTCERMSEYAGTLVFNALKN